MTDTSWAPLSRRAAGLGPDQTVHEGVPRYLTGVLQDWAYDCFREAAEYEGSGLSNLLKYRLRLAEIPHVSELVDDELLDIIDALLAWWLTTESRRVTELEELLASGGAGWRVNASRNGLERRVDATVTTAVAETIRTACDEAGDHLAAAWSAAYGRNPDPDKAYDEAVLAVEAVACPLVAPRSNRATLGTVLRDLRSQTSQWELAIADTTGQPTNIGRMIDMLALLWEGQSRHAGGPNSRCQTHTEAEAAVHLAATLVQWLISGVLHRKL